MAPTPFSHLRSRVLPNQHSQNGWLVPPRGKGGRPDSKGGGWYRLGAGLCRTATVQVPTSCRRGLRAFRQRSGSGSPSGRATRRSIRLCRISSPSSSLQERFGRSSGHGLRIHTDWLDGKPSGAHDSLRNVAAAGVPSPKFISRTARFSLPRYQSEVRNG